MAEMREAGLPGPLEDDFFREVETLDLRAEIQNFWSSEKTGRLNRPLREAFEELVERRRLYEILKVEQGPGAARLTLGHMWRLTRLEGRLLLHTFDLARGLWREQALEGITWEGMTWDISGDISGSSRPLDSLEVWPEIEINPLGKAVTGSYKNLISAWVDRVLEALTAEMKPSPPPGAEGGLAAFISSRFAQLPSRVPAQAIHSALHRHILDRELLDLLFPLRRVHDGLVPLSLYLAAQPHEAGLARLSREAPNFPPLLNFIPPASWLRPDLLQDEVLRNANPVFENLSPAALGWLRRAPAEALARFHHCFKTRRYPWTFFAVMAYQVKIKSGDPPLPDYIDIAREVAETMAVLPPRAAWPAGLLETIIEKVWKLFIKFNWRRADPARTARLARHLARRLAAAGAEAESPPAASGPLSLEE